MPVDVASVSYVLSSVASVGRILETVISVSKRGRPPTSAEFEDIEEQAQAETARRAANGAYMDAHFAGAMSREMIETIRAEMEKITQKLKQAMGDPRLSAADKGRVVDIEQREYCGHLMLIKKFNGDKLPPDLAEDWEKNGCDRF